MLVECFGQADGEITMISAFLRIRAFGLPSARNPPFLIRSALPPSERNLFLFEWNLLFAGPGSVARPGSGREGEGRKKDEILGRKDETR